LPVRPTDLGFSLEEFTGIVEYAPQTRPGRITILEESALTPALIASRVAEFNDLVFARISSSDGSVTPEGVALD
jgi:glycerol-1-phosphate dehydrogenase [NAD(P)+]